MAFRLFRRREESEERKEDKIIGEGGTLSDVLLSALFNNERITKEQALSIPAVSGDIDFIAGLIASMPIRLFKYKDDKVVEVTKDNRVALLNGDTKDTLNAYELKKNLVEDYYLTSGGYCYIDRYRNDIDGLFYVENQYVSIDYNFQPIHKTYRIFVEDGVYRDFEFLKLLRNSKNGAWGTSIVDELNEALQTAFQTQLYQLGLVKSGGNKRGFLKSDHRLGTDEIAALKAAWARLYANNTDNVVVLNNGLDFKEATNTSVEMQLNESIDNLIKQVDKIFHITDDFYNTFKFAIYPVVKAFETALNRDLLLEKEKGKYFFAFDVKEIIKANIKERYECYKLAKEIGFMTKNEIRREENMNDIEGLDVIDLGLGAVLYDINSKTYYTPNTDSTQQLKTIEEESIIDHDNGSEREEQEEQEQELEVELSTRYNQNHGKDGRFSTGGGGSSSGGSSGKGSGSSNKGKSSGSKEEKIKELEKQLESDELGLLAKNKIKNELEMLKSDFNGTYDEYVAHKKQAQAQALENSKKKQESDEEYEKKIKEEEKQQYEEYDKFKDDKIESKPSAEKVEDLKDQRKDFESDEAFEDSFIPLYHGGSKESVEELSDNVEILSVNEKESQFGDVAGGNIYGLSTATTAESAQNFSDSRQNNTVAELFLSKDANIYELKDKHIDDMTYKEINDLLQQGYDAISVGGSENEMRILNPNVVYTKNQIKSAEK